VFPTDGSRDWTVKVDVNYNSAGVTAGQTMYYQFSAMYNGSIYTSPLGSFRAINAANTMSQLNYAVVSCSNYHFGLYNVYDMMAKIDNLDFWSHVGDTNTPRECSHQTAPSCARPWLIRPTKL